MVDLAKHYLGITRCWIYTAAPSGVRSKDVPFGREIVEVFTGGKVMFAADDGEDTDAIVRIATRRDLKHIVILFPPFSQNVQKS